MPCASMKGHGYGDDGGDDGGGVMWKDIRDDYGLSLFSKTE